jgi:hypothetical protein
VAVPVLNHVLAFEPEHRVAIAMSYAVAASRVLRLAEPGLLLNHARTLNDVLHSIDDLVIQTAEVSRREESKS